MIIGRNFNRIFYFIPFFPINTVIHINCIINIFEAKEYMIFNYFFFGWKLPAPKIS